MNRKTIVIVLVLLGMLALAACGAAQGNPPPAVQAADPGTTSRVNLNTATADDFLAAIPGLGNRMVREFMEYRPYISIQQFRREIGKYVDEAQVAAYETYVYVPIAINDSDAETLGQIPGLSADEAASLMAARPFDSSEAFLSKLGEYVSAAELETAKAYLGDS